MNLKTRALLVIAGSLLAACTGTVDPPAPTGPLRTFAPSTTAQATSPSSPSANPTTAPTSAPSATSSAGPTPTSVPSATPSAGPTPTKGPPSQSFLVAGDADVKGTVADMAITCSFPGFRGPLIDMFVNQAGKRPAFLVLIESAKVTVRVATGDGPTLKTREFTGTGVTDFDAAIGAHLDSELTETPPVGGNGIGKVTHITGDVDCGNYTTGSGTVTIAGNAPEGAINGTPDQLTVRCAPNGQQDGVSIGGIIPVGSGMARVFVFATGTTFSITQSMEPDIGHFYQAGADTATTSKTGATISGDAIASGETGADAHTLHVEADVTCGT